MYNAILQIQRKDTEIHFCSYSSYWKQNRPRKIVRQKLINILSASSIDTKQFRCRFYAYFTELTDVYKFSVKL